MRIRKINIKDHPILGNIVLDFCDANGKPVDTVLIAGENGCGKTAVLEVLFSIVSGSPSVECVVEIEKDNEAIQLTYYRDDSIVGQLKVNDSKGLNTYSNSNRLKEKYPMSGIFSDVEINFTSNNPNSVTSMVLDSNNNSQKSSSNMPQIIKQLLIDIQASDDSDISHALRNNPDSTYRSLHVQERIPRFTNAFNRMFDGLTYSRIENINNSKVIVFEKNGVSIPIDSLSSGEKQIVYRGCFLLKDSNALTGAFVFIDEPEISLHPSWQQKIMEYYKGIFTDKEGHQTSQIFAVTHSPFIIHNENRTNDKVIVLSRNEKGEVIVNDKSEYYKCTSIEAVNDAFSIANFSSEKPTVYVEGRTDEKYYNRALEVYNMDVPFQFKWIGYLDENGQEVNTGNEALNKAVPFLVSQNLPFTNICLYDCDANKPTARNKNVIYTCLQRYENDKNIKVGIENALVFGNIDIEPYKHYNKIIDDYGMEKSIPVFEKMECCEHVCSLNNNQLLTVFVNLKHAINLLIQLFNGEIV